MKGFFLAQKTDGGEDIGAERLEAGGGVRQAFAGEGEGGGVDVVEDEFALEVAEGGKQGKEITAAATADREHARAMLMLCKGAQKRFGLAA